MLCKKRSYQEIDISKVFISLELMNVKSSGILKFWNLADSLTKEFECSHIFLLHRWTAFSWGTVIAEQSKAS